jgi:hypothetical protein
VSVVEQTPLKSYTGNGASTVYAFSFRVLLAGDLTVTIDGVTKTLGADYSISGLGVSSGGTVTFTVAPVNGAKVVIYRDSDIARATDYQDNGDLLADTLNLDFDRLWLLIQEIFSGGKGSPTSLRVPNGEVINAIPAAASRSGYYLGFDGAGQPALLLAASGTAAAVASDLANTSDAAKGDALIGVKRTAGSAVSLTLHGWTETRTHTPEEFGAVGNGSTDDTAALVAACAALQTAGGGTLKGVKGKTYKVLATTSNTIAEFSGCNGLTLDFSESLINETKTYSGTESATLFKFTACNNVTVKARVTTQVAVTTSVTNVRGLIVTQFVQGCIGITLDLDVTGGLIGANPTKAFSDSATYISRQITGRIKASGCYYPFAGQFSGHNVDLKLDTDTCGRSFFIYGCNDVRIAAAVKNQQVTSLIKAYNGFGCRDVQVLMVDRDSTANQPAAPRLAIEWGDSTVATHANIAVHLDLKNPSGSPWGNTLEINKYSDGGSTPDVTGRGHVLEGFRLSGISEQVTGVSNVAAGVFGAFVSPDVCRNFSVRDFTALGTSAPISFGTTSPLAVLSGRALFENVHVVHNIYAFNGANGEVTFIDCDAANFSNATTDTDVHTLINCAASDGTVQSVVNKTLINTTITAILRNNYLQGGLFRMTGSKQRSGDLTSQANLFKLPAIGTGAFFRLHYYLVFDQSDFGAGTRREVVGVKSWTATINGSGVWTAEIAVGNEVTERTLNTTPAVLTVVLVNGDSTGAFVACSATNYNNANSKGTFVLDVISMTAAANVVAQ